MRAGSDARTVQIADLARTPQRQGDTKLELCHATRMTRKWNSDTKSGFLQPNCRNSLELSSRGNRDLLVLIGLVSPASH